MNSGFGSFRQAAVTGASGFVGSQLVDLLVKRGISVRALTRSSTGSLWPDDPQIEILRGDVRDDSLIRRLVEGVDVVFHTAALVTPWVKRPAEQYDINFHATKRLIEVAQSLGIPAVCTGSIVALNPHPLSLPLRLLDGNHYVRSKRMVLQFIQRAREGGTLVSSILPSGIIGPGDRRPTNIGKLVREVMSGKAPRMDFGGGLHLIDVRDVAIAHLQAAIKEPQDYVLPGEYWSLDRLYSFISNLSGQRMRRVRIPASFAIAGSVMLMAWSALKTHEAPIITPAWIHYFRQAAAMTYPDDSHKLGFRPRSVTVAVGDAVSWFANVDQQ